MTSGVLAWFAGAAAELVRVAGWELLYSAILFSLVWCLTRLLRTASPVLRHALWGLVLVRLVMPIDLSMPYSLWSLVGRADMALSAETLLMNSWPTGGFDSHVTMQDAAEPATDGTRPEAGLWLLLLAGVWVVGAAIVGSTVVTKRSSYRRVARRARPVTDGRLLAIAGRWKREFRIHRPVRIVTSDEFRSPFTCGWLRPVVFVPDAVLRDDQQGLIESVLAHELAHVARWDDLLLQIQWVISVLYFFNPVAWASARRMRDESEGICDGMVLGSGNIPAMTYGRSILAVLRLGAVNEPGLIPALVSSKERLQMRLERIKNGGPVGRANVLYSLPAAMVLGLFLLPMATTSIGLSSEVAAKGAVQAGQEDVELTNPMPGSRVTSAWGPTINPFTGEEAHHRGIDLAGEAGSPVYAAADGVVEVATTDHVGGENHGTVIIIDHGRGLKTFYSHLDALAVEEGDAVKGGDRIGTQGSTGEVTGPHLHFEIWLSGEAVDPARYVADWSTGPESFRL